MKTLKEAHSKDASYYGDNGDWLIAACITRDSAALERSNFRVFAAHLNALPEVKSWVGELCPVAVERSCHWACGWVDYLVIDPACIAAVALAERLLGKLEDYPVLSDEDFSREEQTEADETWKNCYGPSERIEYIRDHRSQFEFHDFRDLIGCVRGNYFAGYACELLN